MLDKQFLPASNILYKVVLIVATMCLIMGTPGISESKQETAMLANQWMPSTDINGWWMSEKLDGVRGCWTGEEMHSRSGKRIDTPKWFTKNFPPFPLDGELWIGRKCFSEIVSIVKTSGNGKRWKRVRYLIFDVPVFHLPFEKRITKAEDWFKKHPSVYGSVLEQKVCLGKEHLKNELERIEAAGGEGIMLRRPGSLYRVGRSSDILKVKTFHDAEAVVVKHLKGKGRNSDRMGSILVELPSGKQFLIGSGFTDEERENPPPVGSTVTFKYKEMNQSGIPRFASYLRIRQEI